MNIIENAPTPAKQIADLREAVGWNRMESCYKNELMTSFFILVYMMVKSSSDILTLSQIALQTPISKI
mgnify:CR=1 FL=1|jgi:hypothetical protein